MGLDEVIAGSIASAREAGIIDDAPDTGDVDAGDADESGTDAEDTGDVAADGDEGDESAGSGDESDATGDEGDESADPPPAAAKKPVAKAPKVEEGAEDDEDAELGPEKDAKGQVNRIPHPRVQKIVANAENKIVSSVATAFGMKNVTKANFGQAVEYIVGKMKEYHGKASGMETLEPIMENDPDRFVSMLAATNPRYKKFMALVGDGKAGGGDKGGARKAEGRPGPSLEVDLGNGQTARSYTTEDVEKLLDWHENAVTEKLEQRLGARLAPIEQERTNAAKAQAQHEALVTGVADLLEDAHEWEGFKEHEQAVFEYMATLPKNIPARKALQRAYQHVVVKGHYKVNRQTMREGLLKELKKAPKSTNVAGGQSAEGEAPMRDSNGEVVDSTIAVMKRAVARAKAAGLK